MAFGGSIGDKMALSENGQKSWTKTLKPESPDFEIATAQHQLKLPSSNLCYVLPTVLHVRWFNLDAKELLWVVTRHNQNDQK